jgi:DNA-binding NtrC family response regulator
LELLLDGALEKANTELFEHGKDDYKKFSDSAKKIMLCHSWPGNVRELRNTVMRAVLWSSKEIIDEQTARQALLVPESHQGNILERPIGNGFSLNKLLDEVKAHYIRRAEKESGGVKTKAADLLGLPNYQTYSNWQKKL